MKNLIITTVIMLIIASIMFGLIQLVTGPFSVPITNELAVDQLNGGNDAYIAMQAWYTFRNVVTYIGYIVIAIAVTFIIIIIFNFLKERKK